MAQPESFRKLKFPNPKDNVGGVKRLMQDILDYLVDFQPDTDKEVDNIIFGLEHLKKILEESKS